MKRYWIGRHRINIAREPMIGLGFDLSAWPCVADDDHTKRIRHWQFRIWFLAWILAISFYEAKESP